ncbi:hypothetical protein D3C87_1933740 [compost metagenome]
MNRAAKNVLHQLVEGAGAEPARCLLDVAVLWRLLHAHRHHAVNLAPIDLSDSGHVLLPDQAKLTAGEAPAVTGASCVTILPSA